MAIGQVTISAADWLASRVSDRMALVGAMPRQTSLGEQKGGASVPPVEDDGRAQLERRDRERAVLAAQESYKRVAARIKSRIANRTLLEDSAPRGAVLDSVKDSPRLTASILASDPKGDLQQAARPQQTAIRPDPVFAPVEPDQKKIAAPDAQDKAEDAAGRAEAERDTVTVYPSGLWNELFGTP